MCVGGSVCVSGLRVCALQGWSGNRVLCATSQSSLTLLPDTLIQDLSDPPTLDKHTPDPDPVGLDPPLSDCSSTGGPLPERRGAGPDPDPSPILRPKLSKAISYKVIFDCLFISEYYRLTSIHLYTWMSRVPS